MDNKELNESAGRRIFRIYENIKKLRISRGMPVKTFAKMMGVSENKLILAEACVDTECLDLGNVARLCDCFSMTIDDLASENFVV